MKILLVSTERLTAMEDSVCAPLGIMYLGAVAEKAGHEVKLLNLRAIPSLAETKKTLDDYSAWDPDFIGLSAVSPYSPVFETTSEYFRKHNPGAMLVGGGPHPTADNVEILGKGLVDICAMREGEIVFSQLLEKMESGEDYHDIAGISYVRDGQVVENEPAPLVDDLDSLPYPAWHLIGIDRYRNFSGMADFFHWSATMFTSRGCPYRCIYCHKMFGKKFRARSPENVLGEIELLRHKYGIMNIEFVDDIFNFKRDRAIAILEGIRDRFDDVRIAFPNGVRADLLDEEMVVLLKEARCWHVSVAIESASERMQEYIRKNLDLVKLRDAIGLLKKHGIYTRGFLMIGFPEETMEEIMKTMAFSIEAPLNYSLIFIVAPFNKTELKEGVSPDKLKQFSEHKEEVDYRLGNISAGDIPYDTLEKVRNRYYKKGILRFRNRRYWLSAAIGLIRGGAWKRIFIIMLTAIGIGGGLVRKAGIDIRRSEFDSFRREILG